MRNLENVEDCIPYIMPEFSTVLTNASVPLTRRERRALKRKESKSKSKQLSSYIAVSHKTYDILKERGFIKE